MWICSKLVDTCWLSLLAKQRADFMLGADV